MTPPIAIDDFFNAFDRDPVLHSKCPKRDKTQALFYNLDNLSLCELACSNAASVDALVRCFCRPMIVSGVASTNAMPPFVHHISRVFGGCAAKKMVWANARSNVAMMADEEAAGDFVVMKFKRETMGDNVLAAN